VLCCSWNPGSSIAIVHHRLGEVSACLSVLQVRQDPRTEAFYVEGLTHASAQTPARALRVLSEALAWRHTRAHKLNSYSSRSHCLVTMAVTSQDVSSAGQEFLQGSKGGVRR